MLNRMGAKIEGIASNLLTIEGVDELHGTEHTVLPDMIEVEASSAWRSHDEKRADHQERFARKLRYHPRQFPAFGHQNGTTGR